MHLPEEYFGPERTTKVNSATLRKGRVVIVDDDEDIRQMVSAILRRDGHDVIEARDGLDALTRVSSMMLAGLECPDVVVTDVRMHGVDGMALVSGLRVGGCTSAIVVMTAHGTSQYLRRGEADGVAAFLDKPFDIDELRTLVAKLVMGASPSSR